MNNTHNIQVVRITDMDYDGYSLRVDFELLRADLDVKHVKGYWIFNPSINAQYFPAFVKKWFALKIGDIVCGITTKVNGKYTLANNYGPLLVAPSEVRKSLTIINNVNWERLADTAKWVAATTAYANIKELQDNLIKIALKKIQQERALNNIKRCFEDT